MLEMDILQKYHTDAFTLFNCISDYSISHFTPSSIFREQQITDELHGNLDLKMKNHIVLPKNG